MNNRKIQEEKKQAIASTLNLQEWIRVDKAAKELDCSPETIMNNIHEKKYPEAIVRQSLYTRVWFVWLPAVFGFTPEEWKS